jgi:tetratricopeptide (TPR) repeat protein
MMKPAEGLAAAALLGLATAAAAEGPSPSFLDAVERYRRGELVHEGWPTGRLRRAIDDLKQLQGSPRFESFPFEAAAMLLTDLDVEARNVDPGQEEVAPRAAPLLDAARQLLELIPDAARRRRFEQPWLLAVALHLYQRGQWPLALRHLDLGLQRYPEDALFLLARGSLLEVQGAQDLQLVSPGDLRAPQASRRAAAERQASEGRDQLLRAERCYRRALTAEPRLLEARVRLGHVLHRMGQLDKAAPELERAAAAVDAEPRVRYLAWLFLGAIREAEGRPKDGVTATRPPSASCRTARPPTSR